MLSELTPVPSTGLRGGNGTGDPSELSLIQEQVWLDEHITPGTAAYNIPITIHFEGALETEILERSLGEIARRHEVLRATFPTLGHRPVQVVQSDPAPVSIIEVTGGNPADRLERVRSACAEEARRPFDLARGPILRQALFRLSPTEHVLLVVVHHIVFDGWSIGLFAKELADLYAAYREGQPSPLADPPIRYSEFARTQRQRLSGEYLDELVAFWRGYLDGMPRHLALPFDHPISAGRNYRGGRHPIELDKELTASLKVLCQAEGATVYMALLATLATLIYRYTGEADVVIGTPIAQRMSPKARDLLGAFMNTVVLRTDLSGGPSFRQLIARTRRAVRDAYAHQELPYNSLVGALNPERDSTGPSLLQVMLIFQNMPDQDLEVPGLHLKLWDIHTGTTRFDLTLELRVRAGRIVGWFDYDRDLFDAGTITRMAGHLERLLRAIVAEPDACISRLPLLTEAEWHQVIQAWNDTGEDTRDDRILPDMFDAQVERTPGAIAVEGEDALLTYRQLQSRADCLAGHLRSRGVRPGVLVGVCLERSTWMLAGLLGILKAGGAYVPLDPDHPQERLAVMIGDSRTELVLTQRDLLSRLPSDQTNLLCLEECSGESCLTDVLEKENSPACRDDTAYVIYTSGSTGKPKGVAIPHRALSNFLLAMRRRPGMKPTDRLLAITTICFDIAGVELYLPLIVGARVVIASRETATSGRLLMERLREAGITAMQATPATWRMLLEAGWRGDAGLKVLCGGEPLDPRLAEALLARSGSMWNLYGPTETTIWSTLHQVEALSGSIPIGRPIRNTRVYVLDRQLQPVPVGVIGELYISGLGLATGYLHQLELMAQRFVDAPLFEDRGTRMYRTGDVVRWRPEGYLEYLGRLDHQVKIRGFRIELGEIESVLSRHASVREAAVLAREESLGDKRLVAYFVPDSEAATSTGSQLRAFLMKSLPDYMIPSVFTPLKALPLTPNGKIDRKALPAPGPVQPETGVPLAAPRTKLELELTRIWSDVLGIDEVGIHDNFFDLGGHSLLANQVISRMNETFRVKLPLRRLFESPTVAGLAQASACDAPGEVRESIRLLKPGGRGPALFLVHDGLGDTLLYKDLAARMPSTVGVFGIEPRGTGHCPILHTRIPDMAAYYVEQVQWVQPEGPYFLGGLCAGGRIAFEMALQLEAQGHPIGLVVLLDSPGPQMPLKVWLTNQRQLSRFKAALRGEESGSRIRSLVDRSAKVLRKVRNFLSYEVSSRVKRASDARRFEALRRAVDRGRPVSRFVQGLSVLTVLDLAGKEYETSRRLEGKAVLFRASGGEGANEALVNLSSDALLGWGGRFRRELEVVDTPNGHNGMLHEPYVERLAGYLIAEMDRARPDQTRVMSRPLPE